MALRQDQAAGDRAYDLGFTPLPQVVELTGTLTKGKEAPCGEAGGRQTPSAEPPWGVPR